MEGQRHDVERIDDHTAVVTLHTAAGPAAGAQVQNILDDLRADGVSRLVVDLRNPEMLNSKVLDTLVRGAAGLHPRDGAGLVVIADQPYVRQILEITATGGMLFLALTREEALEALPPQGGASSVAP